MEQIYMKSKLPEAVLIISGSQTIRPPDSSTPFESVEVLYSRTSRAPCLTMIHQPPPPHQPLLVTGLLGIKFTNSNKHTHIQMPFHNVFSEICQKYWSTEPFATVRISGLHGHLETH